MSTCWLPNSEAHAWRDNVFVERLWRSVKYEEVYLKTYHSVGEARSSFGRDLEFYNRGRPHSSLAGKTPDQAYLARRPAAYPLGCPTPADAPLIDAENLVEQSEPALQGCIRTGEDCIQQ